MEDLLRCLLSFDCIMRTSLMPIIILLCVGGSETRAISILFSLLYIRRSCRAFLDLIRFVCTTCIEKMELESIICSFIYSFKNKIAYRTERGEDGMRRVLLLESWRVKTINALLWQIRTFIAIIFMMVGSTLAT